MTTQAGPAASARLRVLIAEDEALMRAALVTLISAEPDLEVVGQAPDGQQAVREALLLRPDVVLMDIRMPVTDGISATQQIVADARDDIVVLILTTFENDEHVRSALRAGASGYVLKRSMPADIAQAIRTVAAGGSLVLPRTARTLLRSREEDVLQVRRRAEVTRNLTPREREVLTLIAAGMTNQEIAAELFLGIQTIKTHVTSILTKLGARDRTQAVITAYESGFLGLDS